jgi:hypothetical protein
MRRTLVVVALVAGCHSSSSPSQEILPELQAKLAPKPANGYQIILPPVRGVQPGQDTEYCSWTDLILDHDIDVRAIEGYQTTGGHHVAMFSTDKHQPAGTIRKCTDDDMATFRFSAASGAEGQDGKNQAPGNLVYHIPAGSQIVLNHHYIDATPMALDAQSALNIWLADPGVQYTPSGSIALLNTGMKLPVGPSTLDIECTAPNDFQIWYAIPHMHEYGTRIAITHTSGTTTDTLFDVQQWTPAYTFHPPAFTADPTTPLVVKAGDNMHVHCEWNNTTNMPLTFGLEMCVGFYQTVDNAGLGNMDCDNGQWGTF